jgi:hypothetical protein
MALGGFSGADPILTVDDFARLVVENRVRFALIGDGSEGIRRIFGEAHRLDPGERQKCRRDAVANSRYRRRSWRRGRRPAARGFLRRKVASTAAQRI